MVGEKFCVGSTYRIKISFTYVKQLAKPRDDECCKRGVIYSSRRINKYKLKIAMINFGKQI